MTQAPGEHAVHDMCGFPVVRDADGSWRHADGADALVCDLLFGGGSMLDGLFDQETEERE